MVNRQSIFVGERFQMKSGLWLEVVGYETGKKITVKFDISGFECVVEGVQIRRGNIEDVYTKYPCPGDKYEMNQNGTLEVLEYHEANNVIVRFIDTGYTTRTEACQLKRGTVRDYLLPSVFGVGIIGVGEYSPYAPGEDVAEWSYLKWQNMLERCYDNSDKIRLRTYEGVSVCDEWLNYQNFAAWATKQVGYGNKLWALEKDIISKGNKIYSPDACCFLPQELNNLVLRAQRVRGAWPIGVALHESNGKFVAHVSGTGNSGYVGIYDTPEQAFSAYKKVKERRIKELANKWRSQIDPRAYEALMNYEVLITD